MDYLNLEQKHRLLWVNGFLIFIFIVFVWTLRGIFLRPIYILINKLADILEIKKPYEVIPSTSRIL